MVEAASVVAMAKPASSSHCLFLLSHVQPFNFLHFFLLLPSAAQADCGALPPPSQALDFLFQLHPPPSPLHFFLLVPPSHPPLLFAVSAIAATAVQVADFFNHLHPVSFLQPLFAVLLLQSEGAGVGAAVVAAGPQVQVAHPGVQ